MKIKFKKLALLLLIVMPMISKADSLIYLNEKEHDNWMFCQYESDAVPASIALGIENLDVVEDYIDKNLCSPIVVSHGGTVRILETKKAPLGSALINMHYVQLLKVNGIEFSESDAVNGYYADILGRFSIK